MNFKEIIGSGIVLPEANCDLSSMVTETVDKTFCLMYNSGVSGVLGLS